MRRSATKRIVGRDDPGIVTAERREERDRVGEAGMVRDDEQRSVARQVLRPANIETAGGVAHDPLGAADDAAVPERTVVSEEALCDQTRGGPEQRTHRAAA